MVLKFVHEFVINYLKLFFLNIISSSVNTKIIYKINFKTRLSFYFFVLLSLI